MSYATLILGNPGTGKTASLRNLDPKKTLLIQPIRKPLPFRSKNWREIKAKGDGGNIVVSADPAYIINCMVKWPHDIIVIDDWNYILTRKYMESPSGGNQFDLFKQIGQDGYNIIRAATELDANKRVYVFAHTQTDDMGNVQVKTLGRLLSEKICVEGMFTTVLRTKVTDNRYRFTTRNSGNDTVKTPLGMFEQAEIENDLAEIDRIACEYWGIGEPEEE